MIRCCQRSRQKSNPQAPLPSADEVYNPQEKASEEEPTESLDGSIGENPEENQDENENSDSDRSYVEPPPDPQCLKEIIRECPTNKTEATYVDMEQGNNKPIGMYVDVISSEGGVSPEKWKETRTGYVNESFVEDEPNPGYVNQPRSSHPGNFKSYENAEEWTGDKTDRKKRSESSREMGWRDQHHAKVHRFSANSHRSSHEEEDYVNTDEAIRSIPELEQDEVLHDTNVNPSVVIESKDSEMPRESETLDCKSSNDLADDTLNTPILRPSSTEHDFVPYMNIDLPAVGSKPAPVHKPRQSTPAQVYKDKYENTNIKRNANDTSNAIMEPRSSTKTDLVINTVSKSRPPKTGGFKPPISPPGTAVRTGLLEELRAVKLKPPRVDVKLPETKAKPKVNIDANDFINKIKSRRGKVRENTDSIYDELENCVGPVRGARDTLEETQEELPEVTTDENSNAQISRNEHTADISTRESTSVSDRMPSPIVSESDLVHHTDTIYANVSQDRPIVPMKQCTESPEEEIVEEHIDESYYMNTRDIKDAIKGIHESNNRIDMTNSTSLPPKIIPRAGKEQSMIDKQIEITQDLSEDPNEDQNQSQAEVEDITVSTRDTLDNTDAEDWIYDEGFSVIKTNDDPIYADTVAPVQGVVGMQADLNDESQGSDSEYDDDKVIAGISREHTARVRENTNNDPEQSESEEDNYYSDIDNEKPITTKAKPPLPVRDHKKNKANAAKKVRTIDPNNNNTNETEDVYEPIEQQGISGKSASNEEGIPPSSANKKTAKSLKIPKLFKGVGSKLVRSDTNLSQITDDAAKRNVETNKKTDITENRLANRPPAKLPKPKAKSSGIATEIGEEIDPTEESASSVTDDRLKQTLKGMGLNTVRIAKNQAVLTELDKALAARTKNVK